MSLKEVKSEILEEAQTKADQIIEEAEEEADEIVEEAEEKAEKTKEKYEKELEEEKESYEKKQVSNARMKAKQERLKAKQQVLEDVFDGFREQLSDLTDEQRETYVNSCVEKVGFEPGKIIGSPEFEDLVDLEFEEHDSEGVVIVSEDGEKRQNFTFDKIVDQYSQSYRKQVADTVFE